MKVLVNILFILLLMPAMAQQDSILFQRELKLKTLLDDLRMAKSDSDKASKNQSFKSYLEETIALQGVFNYPFARLKTMGSIKSPDNMFRMFNWNVEQEDQSNKYYCYILRYDERKKKWRVHELVDNSINLPPRPDDILDEANWYGALYYKIIPIKKSGKTLYTLLGLDANSPLSNIKLIDAISFTGEHVKLGSPIFKMKDGVHKRLFFEHSKKAYMALTFDDQYNRIVYDHLIPESPNLEGFYEYYIPEMTYDELRYHDNKWHVYEDVVGLNGSSEKSVAMHHLNKKGKLVTTEVKNKWIDPSDPNAPAGGNEHIARKPDDDQVKKERESVKTKPYADKTGNSDKRYRKSEFSMNPFLKARSRKQK